MSQPIRYRVTFDLLRTRGGPKQASYDVCSLHGAEKAIVLAALSHRAAGKGHILSVSVEPLPDAARGNCEPEDLVDRMEW